MLKNPKIFLLDEATSALDAGSESLVQEALDRLMVGRTTVVVAHRLSTIGNVDSIAVIQQGQVVETGTNAELILTEGASASLIRFQEIVRNREFTSWMGIKDVIVQCKGSLLLELQQRAIEFTSVIEKHHNIRSTLLERIPVLDETTYSGRRTGSLPASVLTSGGTPAKIPNGVAKPAAAALLVDLLDLSSDGTPVPKFI